jgi:subtilisin-like proprotein convertase family protein
MEGGAQVAIALDYLTEDTAACGDPISAEIMVTWDGGSLSHSVPAESFGLIRTGENTQSESPGVTIPDNDLNGLERSFVVSAPGAVITGVSLDVNIPHPFVSDLQVSLEAPTGETQTVFDPPLEQGGEDLVTTYPISAFNGLTADGTYVLKIVDRSGGDVGTLNSWSLTVQHETLVCEDLETRVLQHLLGDPQDPTIVDTNSDQEVDAADLVTAVDSTP